jgi:hypothetical protein
MLLELLATAPAMAQPQPSQPSQPSIDIRWEAPPGCPQESDVRDRVQTLLGAGRHDSHIRTEGTITRMDRRFRLDLVVRVRDLVGTRSIESSSCEDLAGAAAVELGLLIHSAEAALAPSRPGTQTQALPPVRGSEPSSSRSDGTDAHPSQGTSDANPSGRAPDGAKSESKSEVASEAKEQPTQVASQRSWRALVQVPVLELGVGPLPQSTRGIGLALGLEYENWQWQLKGISWQRQSVPAPGFPGYAADVDRIGAAFWGCRELRGSWFGFSPCITVGVERVSATGTGRNIVQSTQHAFGMTLGAGAQGRIYLASWIRLLMVVGGQIELSRPKLSIDGEVTRFTSYRFDVYQFAPAALTAALGLEWIL